MSPIKLSRKTIASFVALQGADSLGTSAAITVNVIVVENI